jgi:hypothetical protein|tara:strand:+ start:276 stop:443 length:168 start_codon:yes stop_codon:yes gene_type:complete
MKNIYEELDRMGVEYVVDTNPSAEKIEKLKKYIVDRDIRIKKLQDEFKSNNLDTN